MRILYEANDEAATAALGAVMAEVLPDGTTIALIGTLGAGKTRLAQAIAEASGVPRRDVVSPTFVLVQEYRGRRKVNHIDAYRLRDEDEFLELGPDEYFEGDGITLVEWADRVALCLPKQYLEVQIHVSGSQQRSFEIIAHGDRYEEPLAAIAKRLALNPGTPGNPEP